MFVAMLDRHDAAVTPAETAAHYPFDGHLRPGGVIAGTRDLAPATRRQFIEIAAALAEHFPDNDDRNRSRH